MPPRALLLLSLLSASAACAACSPAVSARTLAHEAGYAVVTVSGPGGPFANVASVADGDGPDPRSSTGRVLLYLAPGDPTGEALGADPSASVTFSANELRGGRYEACTGVDEENPTCARATLSGAVVPVPKGDTGRWEHAWEALLARHPEMAAWPKGHGFQVMELQLRKVFVVDHYGGAADVPVAEYYNATAEGRVPGPAALLRGAARVAGGGVAPCGDSPEAPPGGGGEQPVGALLRAVFQGSCHPGVPLMEAWLAEEGITTAAELRDARRRAEDHRDGQGFASWMRELGFEPGWAEELDARVR